MTKHQKQTLGRILIAALLFLCSTPFRGHVKLILLALAYLVIGYDVLYKAVSGIRRGQVLDENFLMGIASLGAFLVGQAPEGVAVMLFYQIGELFQSIAVGKSRNSISALLSILPESATVLKNGQELSLCPEEVLVGDILVVRPGEKIPVDGEILEGTGELDTAALTGESFPRTVKKGDTVFSGTVNLHSLLKIRCTKPFGESTASKIMELLENSEMYKAKTERFITRFARYYTPAVVVCALLLALLPPLFLGIGSIAVWKNWIHTALIFLIVSCPCALVISVPMAFFGGIGGASRRGILIKGANHLEMLAKCRTVVFDKTGTLTKGAFSVLSVHPIGCTEEELISLAASAEHYSQHPIALSLKNASQKALFPLPEEVIEVPGGGVSAIVGGEKVLVGTAAFLKKEGISILEHQQDNCIHLSRNQSYLGYIVIADTPKKDAAATIAALKKQGLVTVMLTGDRKEVASALQKNLSIDQMHAELLPKDKVTQLEAIKKATDGSVVFVGDGINDAPVLARADVGISMGGIGSDAAIEASDIVLVDDKPSSVPTAIAISQKTMRIVRQNVCLALSVKLGIMLLDLLIALGAVSLPAMAMTWIAVFGDVGVAVIAILNSLRAMHIPSQSN